MASAATNLFEAESFIGMTLGARTDKTGRSIQILSKAFPFATPALNIRIASIAIDATSTHGIFRKVEDFRIPLIGRLFFNSLIKGHFSQGTGP